MNTDDKKAPLKPCPFCRGEAVESIGKYGDGTPWPYVECIKCGATCNSVNSWNFREALTPKDGV